MVLPYSHVLMCWITPNMHRNHYNNNGNNNSNNNSNYSSSSSSNSSYLDNMNSGKKLPMISFLN